MIQIYSPSNTDYTHNGDCVLMPTRCDITAEINGAWSLQLEHPIDDDGRWRYIEENAVLKVPTWMVNKLQRYRIREVDKTDTMITATAYPVFFDSRDDAYIFDIRISNKTGQQALTQLLTAAPAKYSASSDLIGRQSEVFQNCNLLKAITGPFHDRWGGEILYDNNAVVVNQTIGGDYGVTVEYGKNITGVNYTVDTTDMATRIIPYAYNGRQMSGASPWVDSSLVATYPKVFIRAMQFDDIKLAEDASDEDLTDDSITVCQTQADLDTALTAAVNRQYSVENLDKPKVSMSIDMVSLEDTDEYRDFSSLEEIRLGDTVHCKHSKLGIITDASVVSITWDCARDRIAAVVLGDFAFDFVRDSGLDEIRMGIEQMAANLNADGSLMAERIKGLLDGMVCQLSAQYTAAKRQDVMAILFENLDPQSPLYGALGIGTQGLQISKQRTQDGKGWVWTTAATADGIVADTVVTGTISDKSGHNYWDLDNGHLVVQAFDTNNHETFYLNSNTGIVRINANSFSLTGKSIQQLIEEDKFDPNNLLLEPIELPTTLYWLYGSVTRGQTDPYGGTNAVKLQPVSGGEGFISSLSTNAPAKVAGRRYQLKVWLRSSVDADMFTGNSIKLHLSGVASDDIYPTTSWNEYSMEMLADSSSDGVATICGMSSFTASNGYDLYVYNPRVYAVETQEEAYNRLTNDGALRGIYMDNGQLFINMDYLQAGTAKFGGPNNGNGSIEVYDSNNHRSLLIDNDRFEFESTADTYNDYLTSYYGSQQTFYARLKADSLYNLIGCIGAWAYYGYDVVTQKNRWTYPLGICANEAIQFFIGSSMTTNNNIVTIRKDGSIGNRFVVSGKVYANSYENNSDRRLKNNIVPVKTDIIDDLKPVSFDWKESGEHVSSGFIAQDVQKILPELVSLKDDGMLSLNYIGIIPHLVHKVQQQQKEIDSLKAEIAEIKAILKGVYK